MLGYKLSAAAVKLRSKIAEDFMVSLQQNVRIHNRIASRYSGVHGEIFNEIEQARLGQALGRALDRVQTGSQPVLGLDFGCGTGNLTRHLVDHGGVTVVAADVAERFLDLIRQQYSGDEAQTHVLNGQDLREFDDGHFDFAATYSVLHHVPDYLLAVREMARVLKPGGVLYLDHEPPESFWRANAEYDAYVKRARKPDLQKFLSFDNYVGKLRRIVNPRYTNEGDIHVWPDDHIEWDKIVETLQSCGMQVLWSEEYLLYRSNYRHEVYLQFKDRLVDTRLLVAQKTQSR